MVVEVRSEISLYIYSDMERVTQSVSQSVSQSVIVPLLSES